MKAYRVDKRDLNIGDKILPTGEYFNKLSSEGKIVEEYLEKNRPSNKPKRNEVLYIFEALKDARKFWSKMQNGKLYEVRINEQEILHRSDMQITEDMHNNVEKDQALERMAHEYWKEEASQSSEIEILVSLAIVTKVLSKSETERRKELRKRWDLIM